jgi:hypothetical protein
MNPVLTLQPMSLSFFLILSSRVSQSVQYVTTDGTTGVRSPVEAKDFSSSLCDQTSPEAHPASYPMGTSGPFPGVNRGRAVTLTTYYHLLPRSRMSRSYIPSLLSDYMACSVTVLFFTSKPRNPMSLPFGFSG